MKKMNMLKIMGARRKELEAQVLFLKKKISFVDASIGEKIRERMIANGISLRNLAKEMGLSAAYLSDVCLGRRTISAENIKRIDTLLKKLPTP